MLALYHLFSGIAVSDLPQEMQELCAEVGVRDIPAVRRVVLVGTELRPGEASIKSDGTVVNTLWGELAWQLGGAEAFARVATVDANRTSPGDTLGALFERYGPCLVLIDEWVAYARQLYSRDDLTGGTLDTQTSFAQALTEQATAVEGTLVVVSIPASTGTESDDLDSVSETEVGGFGGKEALKKLRAVVGRMDSPWAAATSEESFEIVRRRLFEPLADAERLADRDTVARTFTDFYRKQSAEFPTECREPAYAKRIVDAYPIHPELFERLYEDWSTLERFQRTRGVLRLMAAVVHALWRDGDNAPLVLPAGIPLDDATVITELLKHLSEGWRPIVDADIDGPTSTSVELDRTVPSLGRYQAARRVARTVFFASAPHAAAANRGVEAQRVRLGCVIPGESVATFGDALNRLSDRSTYLYHEGPRYWYGTQQSVTKRAQERADQIRQSQRDEVHDLLLGRVRADHDRGEFGAVHVGPPTSADVPDDDLHVRLVVLDPTTPHSPRSQASAAIDAAREILERRGNAAREYRNLLVFAAADARRIDDLERAAAEYLAWSEIDTQAEELNLDAMQRRMASEKRAQADDAVRLRLAEAYQWALVPTQPDPVGDIVWEPVRVDGSGPLAARISKKLGTEDLLRSQFPGVLLRLQLDGPLATLWTDGHVSAKSVWDCFARYVYLPRLRDLDVLLGAVEQGPASTVWANEGFAVAVGEEQGSGRFLGLVTGSRPDGPVAASTLIVRPDVALGQREQEGEQPPELPQVPPGAAKPGGGQTAVTPRRFHGAKQIDLSRPVKDFDRIMSEVLQHLRDGTEVTLVVDISASSEAGFSEQVVRIVTENAATLGFEPGSGFEEQ